jgi:hypothetical protein
MEKKQEKKTQSSAILLSPQEREALNACATANFRSMGHQMRLYVIQGLERDGYLTSKED